MAMTLLNRTLQFIGNFYDNCRFGYEGFEGYRKSTDPFKFVQCLESLKDEGFLKPQRTLFMDLGCADGRVNVMAGYFVKRSLGIEIDPDILAEYFPRRAHLARELESTGLLPLPANIALFQGSSLEEATFDRITKDTGITFEDVDLFYTYITLHDLFAEMIAAKAKMGAHYLVYGFNKVLPHYDGLEIVIPDVASQGIAALYRKIERHAHE